MKVWFLALMLFGALGFGASNTLAKPFKVVTTFTIIADIAARVAGDAAKVESLTKVGAGIHNYQPTPRDILRGYDADLLLANGMGLELWFEQFWAQLPPVPKIVVSKGIQPISIAEGDYQGKPNPHAWMSPANGLIYIRNIRDALMEHDPKNAAVYQQNAEKYTNEIQAMIAPMRQKIAQIPRAQRWLVTSEGAFSYFTRDFQMQELYLWPINADQVGTPQQVRGVIDAVNRYQIPVVFSESTVSSKPMQQVARETNSLYGGELYVDSLSSPDGLAPNYLALLQVTTQTIIDGFVQVGVLSQ